MSDSEKKENGKGVMLLSDRMERALSRARSMIVGQMPRTGKDYCVMCGATRLDPDPTGVTCGKLSCLAALGESFDASSPLSDKIKKFASENGIPDNLAPETILETIGSKLELQTEITDELQEIALILGVNTENKSLLVIVTEIHTHIEDIDNIIKKTESG